MEQPVPVFVKEKWLTPCMGKQSDLGIWETHYNTYSFRAPRVDESKRPSISTPPFCHPQASYVMNAAAACGVTSPSNSMVCIRLRIVTLRTARCHRARPAVRGVVFVVGGDLGFESFGESVAPYDPLPDPLLDPSLDPLPAPLPDPTPGTSRPAAPFSGPAESPDPALPAAGAGRNASGSAESRSDPLAGRGSSSEPVAPYLGGMVLRCSPRIRSPS